ncbi:hypothetical protein ILUMI_12634 [Ignelater luminosus]|uniref:Uncharacterized protein n=1 Tax=Ignelater luminosus TaxID=2038154 RepID=A0A8K0CW26_IGNLU|nr:hypothetical protein ILUMI_12634 [Ignelater luminosus]
MNDSFTSLGISDGYNECDSAILEENPYSYKGILSGELATLTAERELHLRKADAFFDLKKRYKAKAEAGETEYLTFDFMQNLPLPYIPSNPAFYACQLWYFVFGIHNLVSKEATIYTYHEEKPEHKHSYEEIFSKNDQVKAEATIEVDEDDNSSGCEEF